MLGEIPACSQARHEKKKPDFFGSRGGDGEGKMAKVVKLVGRGSVINGATPPSLCSSPNLSFKLGENQASCLA